MNKTLLSEINLYQMAIGSQYDDVYEWTKTELSKDTPDRDGVSQRLGFLGALQAFSSIIDDYKQTWNFVSKAKFEHAIAVAGDQFRALVASEKIIPNNPDLFEGVKGQLTQKLDEIIQSEEFFDNVLVIALDEYPEVNAEDLHKGFEIARGFIVDLDIEDLQHQFSADEEAKMAHEEEKAEGQGNQWLKKVLRRLDPR